MRRHGQYHGHLPGADENLRIRGGGGRRGKVGAGEFPDLDAITAHVCQSLGWTWDQVDQQLDFPRLKAFNDYWKDIPPTHIAVRRIGMSFGVSFETVEPGPVADASADPKSETEDILDMLAGPAAETESHG